MFIFLGVSLAFASFFLMSLLLSLLASAVGRLVLTNAEPFSARTRAQVIFALRVWPVAFAFIAVVGLVMPAFILYEPAVSNETVTKKLGILAILSISALCFATFRTIWTVIITQRLTAKWLERSDTIRIDGLGGSAYRLEHSFPVMAVVGVFRPRLFVARKVLESLTPSELNAAISHELGHIRSRDNFKRVILNVCRCLLLFPVGSGLDEAWSAASEEAADFSAAGSDPSRAMDLASALVKLARIAPTTLDDLPMASCALLVDSGSSVAERVGKLLMIDPEHRSSVFKFTFLSSSLILPLAVVVVVGINFLGQEVLVSTHEVIEGFVGILQ